MRKELKKALPMAEAFTRLLSPFAEVVIHDLHKDQIEAIFNPFSKRKVGDPSYLESAGLHKETTQDVIGPYEKSHFDGRKLKSISIVIRDELQIPVGFLCINMDLSHFTQFQKTLQIFMQTSEPAEELFRDDLYEQMDRFVSHYCQSHQLSYASLTRDEKKELIQHLKERGALNGKHATHYIARILEISRATVYNYLNAL